MPSRWYIIYHNFMKIKNFVKMYRYIHKIIINEIQVIIYRNYLVFSKQMSRNGSICRNCDCKVLYCPPMYKFLKWNCWKFWSWEMKYHHSSVVESKSFHHSWLGFASSLVMKWFWFNSRLVMIFHFSTPEFSAIVHFIWLGK